MGARSGQHTFYEFFAGGGMARLGLGSPWRCLFANDLDPVKAEVYRTNFGSSPAKDVFKLGDVWDVTEDELEGHADLAWASFPCQDLSLAGRRAGLAGERSGTFYGFWRLVDALDKEGRAPRLVVLENVAGVLTSNGGHDFREIVDCMARSGYDYGALELDASHFTPQSRPRLFFIGSRDPIPSHLLSPGGPETWDTPPFGCTSGVIAAVDRLPKSLAAHWRWLAEPVPPRKNIWLEQIVEKNPPPEAWHTPAETNHLLSLMSDLHSTRLDTIRKEGQYRVGAVFRRTRTENGERAQRAEARFDGLAGCLRTPQGGSSRQQLIIVEENGEVRTRAMTPRETARLMGLPESYKLPEGQTAALKVTGDGVAVPVVRWLARQILEPLLQDEQVEAA
ncbi:MAG: DNA cytosine methyltransferase [Maricaulaceae bacterium]|jgi:DNA (cytosine-5)-methyltransferase 1